MNYCFDFRVLLQSLDLNDLPPGQLQGTPS